MRRVLKTLLPKYVNRMRIDNDTGTIYFFITTRIKELINQKKKVYFINLNIKIKN